LSSGIMSGHRSDARIVTRSGDVGLTRTKNDHHHGPYRSQVQGGRSSAAIPEIDLRPDMKSRQEIENPAEIEITIPTTRKGDLHR